MTIDFGKTSGDYRAHRAGFPPALLERLRDFGVGLPGQRLLDLGTGTGSLARQFALRGCEVSGLDPAPEMLEQARGLDQQTGVRVVYREGRAEVTGYPEATFDVVAAGQCWHWFDRPAAAAEVRRILVPGGSAVICHFDWIALAGNMVAATEALILKHNPKWGMGGGHGIYPWWFTDLAQAGFEHLESFTFDLAQPYTHEAWRGRIRASAGVAASLPPEGVQAFDAELKALLARDFPDDPLLVPHRVFAVIGRKPDEKW